MSDQDQSIGHGDDPQKDERDSQPVENQDAGEKVTEKTEKVTEPAGDSDSD